MAVLHILSNPDARESCLTAMADGDALVVLGDGTFALPNLVAPERTGAVAEDAFDRGIVLPDGIDGLTYADLVDWVVACRSSVTWT